jgi:hypothetical protein
MPIKHDLKFGFTGTRHGMTPAQRLSFEAVMESRRPDQFMHGACVGADEQATLIANQMKQRPYIMAYPGYYANVNKRAEQAADNSSLRERSQESMRVSDMKMEPQSMFMRNRHLVLSSDELVACPWQGKELEPLPGQEKGGTWYTIRYAERIGRTVHIIWPNGDVETRMTADVPAMKVEVARE